jgi:hypothetical protein
MALIASMCAAATRRIAQASGTVSICTDRRGRLLLQDLHCCLAVLPQVRGLEYNSEAATANFRLDRVSVRQCGRYAVTEIGPRASQGTIVH